MTKLENLQDTKSCFAKAADDEPIFVLRAKDPTASAVIGAWIRERIALDLNRRGDDKIKSAETVAGEMADWRREHA